MKLKSKFKSNRGSAMMLAIILTLLVSILAVTFSNQIANVIRTNSRSYSDMQIKYNLEAGIEKVISKACTKMEQKLKESLSDRNLIYSPSEIILGYEETYEIGNLIPIESFNINNDDIQQPINNRINYALNNEITINLNVEAREYIVKNKYGQNVKVYTYVNLKEDKPTPISIDISTQKNNKQYKSKFEIKFMITDIKNCKAGYSVIQWNSK